MCDRVGRNAYVRKRTNTMETTTGEIRLERRNNKGDAFGTGDKLVYKLKNTMFQKKAGKKLIWESPE